MSAGRNKRLAVGDDGELREVAELARQHASQPEVIFCIHCGTANRPEGRFCRSCGHALDEQTVDPELAITDRGHAAKTKAAKAGRSDKGEKPARAPMTGGEIALEMLTMLVIVGAVLLIIASPSAWMAIPLLLVWFMVVAARHGAFND